VSRDEPVRPVRAAGTLGAGFAPATFDVARAELAVSPWAALVDAPAAANAMIRHRPFVPSPWSPPAANLRRSAGAGGATSSNLGYRLATACPDSERANGFDGDKKSGMGE
jgi:hypothetical protein